MARRRHAARLLWIAPLLLTLASVGCGYHVVGSNGNLPKSWRTVSVPVFANHTLHYRLGQIFTQAVVRELEARTTYRIVPDPAQADAVLMGDITSIRAVPVLFDSKTGRATTMLVTVEAKVRLKDRASGKVIYRNDRLVFRDEYEFSTDPKSFFQEEDPALGRMARDFASRVVSDMLENF
ncbi:MAG TPA: LptE family protein [Candidatus Dormibacteraeota bacterium]|nr:LptE family protein [Candidatus Dormibacteraeota bacterium]